MKESDLRILESLLTSFTEEDWDEVNKARITNPQEKLTDTLESYLSNRLSKLIEMGADQSKIDECREKLQGIRNNV